MTEQQASNTEGTIGDRVTALLLELSAGSCSITEETVAAEQDPNMAGILFGLLMLWEDLQYQSKRRNEAEAEMRAREARFRALFELSRVSIWDCDVSEVLERLNSFGSQLDARLAREPSLIRELTRSLKLRAVNPQTFQTFEARDQEEFQAKLPSVFGDSALPMLWQLWGALARGEKQLELEGMLLTLNGKPLNVVMGVSLAESQATGGTIVTVSDVTPIHEARRAAEELARVRADELDHVNAEVERLFYAVSHDLRAPLRGVENLAEWAIEDMDEGKLDDVKGHISNIGARVARLDRMLNDLLSYARVGRTDEAPEIVQMDVMMQELKSNMLQLPDGFTLRWSSMPTLVTQRTLLTHVLLNLISNAVKHHDRERGSIEISAHDQGPVFEFQVRDDGPGIPEKYREKVFDLFSTLKRRDEVEGSGMGLAFVKKVVRNQGGDVRIKSTGGRGTIVSFTWPKAPH